MRELQIRKRHCFLYILHLGDIGRKVRGKTTGKTEDSWEVTAGVRWWGDGEIAVEKGSSGWTGAIWEVDGLDFASKGNICSPKPSKCYFSVC